MNSAESSGLKATGIFETLLNQVSFESNSTKIKFQTITSWSQFGKVNAKKPISKLWTAISNQMIK